MTDTIPPEAVDPPGGKMRAASRRRLLIACRGFIVLLWAVVAWWYLLPPTPESVEKVFSLGIFRCVGSVVVPLADTVPFSLGMVVVLLLLAGFPLLWIARWIHIRRAGRGSHWRGLLRGPIWLLIAVPVLLAWFLLCWGAGYQRLPVEERLGLDASPVTAEEEARLHDMLLETIRRDLPLSGRSGRRDTVRALAAVSDAMAELVETWDGKPVTLPRGVKATPSGLLLATGTTGICSPFTLEAHVDGGLPDTAFVQTGAHELAHIAGICGEGEANMAGYIAGLRARDPFARYAVALGLYVSLINRLPDEERKRALAALPKEALLDLRRRDDAVRKHRIDFLQQLCHGTYNKYLEAQGVEEGMRSYARGTALFVFAWRAGYVPFP